MIQYIDKLWRNISIFFIKIYQFTLSPDKWLPSFWLKWKVCIHEPHCSQYSINTLKRYNLFRSRTMIFDRITSCTAWDTKKYDPDHYRVVFFSSAPIGAPFLESLHSDPHFEVVWVVTMPDQPSWRWMKMQANIIKTKAIELFWEKISGHSFGGIQTPRSLRITSAKYWEEAQQFQDRLTALKPDYIVVIAYGNIIPQAILDIPQIAPINVHGSLLPEYRWASPLQSVFLDKKTETGITVMKMFATLDTGDMIDKLSTLIPFSRTVSDLVPRIQEKWPTFLNKTLVDYAKWRLVDKPQDDSKATLCRKIQKEDWLINPFQDSIESIYAKYRAYHMRPKTYFIAPSWRKNAGKTVTIDNLTLDKNEYATTKHLPLLTKSPLWGEEARIASEGIKLRLKPEWKQSMSREDFVNWYIHASSWA